MFCPCSVLWLSKRKKELYVKYLFYVMWLSESTFKYR